MRTWIDPPGPGVPSSPNVRVQWGAKPSHSDYRFWLRTSQYDPETVVGRSKEEQFAAYKFCSKHRKALLDDWRRVRGPARGELNPAS